MSALAGAAYLVVVVVLLVAAAGKARDVRAFAADVAGYRLLPPRLAVPATWGVVAAEVAAAGLLSVPSTRTSGGVLAAALFAAFLAAMGTALGRGLDVPCGCFGGSADRVGPRTLVRTGLLLVLAVTAAVAGGAAPFAPAQVPPAVLLLAVVAGVPLLVPAGGRGPGRRLTGGGAPGSRPADGRTPGPRP
ncbi:MauE/DoxX family redox-associated membrane protein, partial [Nonomuraea sp. NPDC050783]|uniref:MauE/DoxX family redox-associated membrane protein n=1 Tax=Nonomuraea sp. NPDC050783 TaxID=3154634 RepID=UPI0034677E76